MAGNTPQINANAIALRQRLTPAERELWFHLRNRNLAGLKFRRQHPAGRFILDFYCVACKLAIELDGSFHIGREDYDEARTEQLESWGCTVLRFQNEEVFEDLEGVLERVRSTALELLAKENALTPSPSPVIGRGEPE